MSSHSNYLGAKKCCATNLAKTVIGPQGAQGAGGPIGSFGYQGATGAPGIQGATGPCCRGPQGYIGSQGATGPSQWTSMNGISLKGQGYTGIGVTGQDVLIYGNLLVTGNIDTLPQSTYNTTSVSLNSTSSYSQTFNIRSGPFTATLPLVDASNVGVQFLITNTNAITLAVSVSGTQLIYSSIGGPHVASRSLAEGHSHIFTAIKTTGATTYGWSMV